MFNLFLKRTIFLGKKKSLYKKPPHVYNQSDKVSKVWSINFGSDSCPFYSTVQVCWISYNSWCDGLIDLVFPKCISSSLYAPQRKKTTHIKNKPFPVVNRSVEQWIESHSLGTFHHFMTFYDVQLVIQSRKKSTDEHEDGGCSLCNIITHPYAYFMFDTMQPSNWSTESLCFCQGPKTLFSCWVCFNENACEQLDLKESHSFITRWWSEKYTLYSWR